MSPLISPAQFTLLGFPLSVFSLWIPLFGIAAFTYIMARRMAPLVRAAGDARFDRIHVRIQKLLLLWLGQVRQPRYMAAGVIHIVIFGGFLILSLRSMSLVVIGLDNGFVLPGFGGHMGEAYNILKDLAATLVFIACLVAAYRRGVIKPSRYAVPKGMGKDHTGEALLVLGIIATLMISESLFEATAVAAGETAFLLPLTLPWIAAKILSDAPLFLLQGLHLTAYYVHDIVFFGFLCFLPMGKHFHVITSLFNVWFMRLDKGNIKPVKYGIADEELFDLESFGVKKMEDFTWKHILDFYSCADCGRCSDNCPANASGRPLSPRFITIKGRDRVFADFCLDGTILKSSNLVGSIFSEDEIWSCTTCGACEEECPLAIEYIDKIVDLRRGMVDEGMVPQSLQKPLKALEKRGNPYGMMEKKRADWTLAEGFSEEYPVRVLDKKEKTDTLYFVDSISSYEDRMQEIARATSKILMAAGVEFGILGKREKDGGNEVRRFGEEMLFQDLKEQNREAIASSCAKKIVTADPHALNVIKNDYADMPPVSHIGQVALAGVASGALRLLPVSDSEKVYTYHDPCYLGRHNDIYEDPRALIDAIPGIKRVEMERSASRSFCCGGGGLMLFYEPEEETRMGLLRVAMAKEAGADVIVTACPFCLVNIEDAVKVAGLEGEIAVIDLAELIADHLDAGSEDRAVSAA